MTGSAPVTWKQLVVDDDSSRIVEEVSGYSRSDLALHGNEEAPTVAVARINEMVARRMGGEPLQYVLGGWSFRELDLFVDSRVLIPRPETEIVAQVAIDAAKSFDNPLVVDLGTGSGAIALSIAHEIKNSSVIATDVSDDALAVARANLAGIGNSARRVQLRQGSWFEALNDEERGKIDVIVSNPPYIADDESLPEEVIKFEPSNALFSGPKGTEYLEEIILGSSEWLSEKGQVVLECSPNQIEYLLGVANECGLDSEVISDLAGRARVIRTQRR